MQQIGRREPLDGEDPAMTDFYDRAKLLAEVWTEPVQVVAPRYNLSDVGLKKLCARLQIPTPPRGHWAKVRSGKRGVPQPKLRDYTGQPQHLIRPTYSARREEEKLTAIDPRLASALSFEEQPENQISVPARVSSWHPVVAAARDGLARPFIDRRQMPQSRGNGLNISVSESLTRRALVIADAFLKALEKRGYVVRQGAQNVEIVVLGDIQRLRFFESSVRSAYKPSAKELAAKARGEWSYWPNFSYTPSGRLQVLVDDGYGGKIVDKEGVLVEQQLNKLIKRMITGAVESMVRREHEAIKDAERQAVREIALVRQQKQDAERARLEVLEADALLWQRAEALRRFLDAKERALSQDHPLTGRELEDLEWGRSKADWIDPLNPRRDALLEDEIVVPAVGWRP
jgi:hypothetical protein